MRSGFLIRNTGIGTHQVTTVIFQFVPAVLLHHHHPVTVLHSGSNRSFQAFLVHIIHHQLIDNNLDIMYLITVYCHSRHNLPDLTVDTCRQKSFFLQTFKQILIMPFSSLYHRR